MNKFRIESGSKTAHENVNKSNGKEIKINYVHEQESKECSITPVQTEDSEYKIGLWVRDSAAGVGTVTFYNPETNEFAALGHGILDIDTEKLINISSGEFVTTNILKIEKGEKGNPGRIQGTLEKQKEIGKIKQNTGFGIYGQVEDISSLNIDKSKEMEVALRNEIQTGKAEILCSLENGKIDKYEIEIKKRIAFLTGNTKLYKDLSAYELLTMCGDYYRMSKKDIKDRIKYLNKTFDMESFLYQRIGTLSTGQTQRVSIARCLMHDPKYYILDEPTSGLDIISSKVILDTIKEEKDKGKCILYSTHYMEEAESICDRVVLMNNGKIITIGTGNSFRIVNDTII